MQENRFTGILEKPEGPRTQHVGLIRNLLRSSHSGLAIQALGVGGVRDKSALTVEKLPQGDHIEVFNRGFNNMAEHNLVVGLSTGAIADLIGLDKDEKRLVVTGGLMHDATKKLEVIMLGYRAALQEGTVDEEKNKVIIDSLTRAGITDKELTIEQVRDTLSACSQEQFFDFFDQKVNAPFIHRMLNTSDLSPEEREQLFRVATSDSASGQPRVISIVSHYAENLPNDEVTDNFRERTAAWKRQGIVPEIEPDNIDFLSMILWYSDSIVAHNRIAYLDERLDDVVKRGAYGEIDRKTKDTFGQTYYEVARLTNHMIERILKARGVANGTINPELPPEELPRVIFDHIQQKDTIFQGKQ